MPQNIVMRIGKKTNVKKFNMHTKNNKNATVKPVRKGVTYEMFAKNSKLKKGGCGCGGF